MFPDPENIDKDTSFVVFACLVAEILQKIGNLAAILFMQIRQLKRKISLGNRVYRIQHAQIMLKSLVPNFYPKMPLRFTYCGNPTSLLVLQLPPPCFLLCIDLFDIPHMFSAVSIILFFICCKFSFTSRYFCSASSTLSLSFYTCTLGSSFLCYIFVILNCVSLTKNSCFGTHSLFAMTL